MKSNALHRYYLGKYSFLIPEGFIGRVSRSFGDFAFLLSGDRTKTIELRIEKDCEGLKKELTEVVDELGEKILRPVAAVEINGISGYAASYKGHRSWYYEVWLGSKDYAVRIIIRSQISMDTAAAEAWFGALDIREG